MKRAFAVCLLLVSARPSYADAPARLDDWVLVERDGSSQQGSMSTARIARAYQQRGEPLWYVVRGGKAYVVRDEAVLRRVRAAWVPAEEQGKRMGEVGKKMGMHGDKQRIVGEKMGAIGAKMGAIGAKLADLKLDRAERERLRKQMDRLQEEMEPLRAEMESYTEQMRPHAAEMEKLGKEMERRVTVAQAELVVIFDDAKAKGLATEVK
jgi:bla regulator protein blaR1